MKKLVSSLLVGACAFALAAPLAKVSASAAEKTSVFLEEDFNDLVTTKWAVDSASDSMKLYSSDNRYLSFDNHSEQYVLGTTEKLAGLEYFQFDYMPMANHWTPIYFTNTTDLTVNGNVFSKTDAFYTYEPTIAMELKRVTTYSKKVTVDKNFDWLLETNVWYTIRMTVVSPTQMEISYAPQGESMDLAGTCSTVTLKDGAGFTFDDMYVLFGRGTDAGQELKLDNLKIKYGESMIDEDFNGETIDERLKDISAIGKKGYSVEKAASMLSVNAANPGDNILYAQKVGVETSVIESIECLDIRMNVNFKDGLNDSLSFAFGIKDETDYKKGCVTLDMYANGIKFAQVDTEGVKRDLTEKVKTDKLVKEATTLRLTANKDGQIRAYVNDELLLESKVLTADYYAGAMGYIVTEDKANSGVVMVDQIQVYTTRYKVPVTKSVTHNFSNDYFGKQDFEDFIMNSTGGGQYVQDGRLVWDGLSDYSYFGSAHEYDDFILEFKICNILTSENKSDIHATGLDRWLGIDIAKSVPGLEEYGSSAVFMFNINSQNEYDGIGYYVAAESNVDKAAIPSNIKLNNKIPSSLFKAISYDNNRTFKTDIAEKDAVCVRWVAERGTLRLYLKKACELNYTLYTVIENVDTTGYVALCCTGYTFLELDDFSMSNISSVYVPADNYVPETIIKTEEVFIYDRGNVDVNGATEAQLNESSEKSGCGSSVAYCVTPVAILGSAIILKKKGKEEK